MPTQHVVLRQLWLSGRLERNDLHSFYGSFKKGTIITLARIIARVDFMMDLPLVQPTRRLSHHGALPTADPFAGRKTKEPPPVEDDPMERPDIRNLINSELQPPE